MQGNLDTTNIFLGMIAVVSVLEALLLIGVGIAAFIVYRRTMALIKSAVIPKTGAAGLIGDDRICKVSIVGIGMRSHVGVASKMFAALSAEGINIQMITTSEIKTSVVLDEKYMELAVRALHKAFDLDQAPNAP